MIGLDGEGRLCPIALTAFTEMIYDVPFVKPVICVEPPVEVRVGVCITAPSATGDVVTIYPVTGLPTIGFVTQDTLTSPGVFTATTVGLFGRGYGVAVNVLVIPIAFIARTTKLYTDASFKPVIVIDLSVEAAKLGFLLSGVQMILYPVIGEFPSERGGVQLIIALLGPGDPLILAGSPGTVGAEFDEPSVTELLWSDDGEFPTTDVAITIAVIATPVCWSRNTALRVPSLAKGCSPPFKSLTIYESIELVPELDGGFQVTVIVVPVPVICTLSGLLGTVGVGVLYVVLESDETDIPADDTATTLAVM